MLESSSASRLRQRFISNGTAHLFNRNSHKEAALCCCLRAGIPSVELVGVLVLEVRASSQRQMRRHRSALSIATHIEREIRARKLVLEHAVEEASDELFREGYKSLSGTKSQQQLDSMGNPYGRGFSTPRGQRRMRVSALPINAQSDRLRRAWVKQRSGARIVLGFRSAPDYARFVLSEDGTRLMRARGFTQHMTSRYKAVRLGIRRAYKRKT